MGTGRIGRVLWFVYCGCRKERNRREQVFLPWEGVLCTFSNARDAYDARV
jgi:hypothetical protein